MKLDPIDIAVAAFVVSLVSLILTVYRAGVDRYLQWEQVRGRTYSRLTARGVELLILLEELRRAGTPEAVQVAKKLIQVSDGLITMRRSLARMKNPTRSFVSRSLTMMAPIVSDLDDTDPVFEMLTTAVKKSDMSAASEIADGLILRIFGNEKAEPSSAVGATSL